jgi:hypothetical protein
VTFAAGSRRYAVGEGAILHRVVRLLLLLLLGYPLSGCVLEPLPQRPGGDVLAPTDGEGDLIVFADLPPAGERSVGSELGPIDGGSLDQDGAQHVSDGNSEDGKAPAGDQDSHDGAQDLSASPELDLKASLKDGGIHWPKFDLVLIPFPDGLLIKLPDGGLIP